MGEGVQDTTRGRASLISKVVRGRENTLRSADRDSPSPNRTQDPARLASAKICHPDHREGHRANNAPSNNHPGTHGQAPIPRIPRVRELGGQPQIHRRDQRNPHSLTSPPQSPCSVRIRRPQTALHSSASAEESPSTLHHRTHELGPAETSNRYSPAKNSS
jgi:hypothetical protein